MVDSAFVGYYLLRRNCFNANNIVRRKHGVMRFELTRRSSDSEKHTGHTLGDLERHLELLPDGEQFQLWMFKDDGESACCLCNRTRAWLTIMHKAGEDS